MQCLEARVTLRLAEVTKLTTDKQLCQKYEITSLGVLNNDDQSV